MDKMAFEFRCLTASGSDLCFNNGTCVVTDFNTERCKCQGGFSPDMFYFHFDNCVAYDGIIGTWLPFASGFAVIYVVITYILAKILRRLRSRDKRLAIVVITAWTLTILFVLSPLFQNGCYEACAVFSSSSYVFDYASFHLALITVMEALQVGTATVVSRRQLKLFNLATALLMAGSIACGIAMLVYTRDEDRRSYNIAAVASAITLWLAGCLYSGWFIFFATTLETKILDVMKVTEQVYALSNGSRPNLAPREASSVGKLIPRLRALRLGSFAILIPFLLFLVPFPIVLHILGSIPYMFLFTISHFLCEAMILCGFVGFLYRTNQPKQEESGQSSSAVLNSKEKKLKFEYLASYQEAEARTHADLG